MRKEIDKVRHGDHGARSPQQAIAIGLSEARRAGVDLPPPKKGKRQTQRKAEYDYEVGQRQRKPRRRPKVARAVKNVLKRERRDTTSSRALSKQTKRSASQRSRASRSAAARKAARTKGASGRSAAARKAAKTRQRRKGTAR